MKRALAAMIAVVAACGESKSPPPSAATAAAPPPTAAAPGSACPATGAWASCSVLYRLERAGLAPKLDSTAKPDEKSLGGQPLMVKIGLSALLEVHLYADSAARSMAAAKLDRSQLVNGTQEQTIKREKTLIESANLVALLTSLNSHQRERVSDALSAGPPQPGDAPQPMPAARSTATPPGA